VRRKILLGAAALGVLAVSVPVVLIGPRNLLGMWRYDIRAEGKYQVGDPAPDVDLLDLEGRPVHLKERLAGRPLVLVFGSFT
jgi:hypothetical protein